MIDYQQRVVEEEAQLAERVSKLRIFRHTLKWSQLSLKEHDLLHIQLLHMEAYLAILRERIAAFPNG